MHHGRKRSRTFTVQAQLRTGFGLIVLLSVLLCAGIYVEAVTAHGAAAGLAFQLSTETGPCSRVSQAVEDLGNKIALFTRTHDKGDLEVALTQHAATLAVLTAERGATDKAAEGTEFGALLKAAKPQLAQIKVLCENTAAQFLKTDRSTRGIASQTSVLLTSCTQLLNNDGVAIQGPLVPAYRPTLIKALNELGEIQNATLFAQASVDPAQLDRANARLREMTAGLMSLATATPASDLHDFLSEVAQSTRDLGDELANLQQGLTQRRQAVEQLLGASDNLRRRFAPIVEQGMRTASITAASTNRSTERMLVGVMVGAIVIAAAGFAASAYISTRMVVSLKQTAAALAQGAEEIFAAASQVASSSQSLAEGASRQTASLEESTTSLEEMTGRSKRDTAGVMRAKELSSQTRTAAESGATDLQAMKRAMDAIKVSSDGIARIIKTIDEIAFQTNILALNAAVEAARAGEAGAGFAVVADEVRNLAQRAAGSAKETAAKIDEAIANSGQGVRISDKVAGSLATIADRIKEVDRTVADIAAASTEQSEGMDRLREAIGRMEAVTKGNASSAEETASAAEKLNAQAMALREAVAELSELAGMAAVSAERPARAEEQVVPPAETGPGKTGRREVSSY